VVTSAGDSSTLPSLHAETVDTSLCERLLDPRSRPRSGEVRPLARNGGAQAMIAHHYGLFDFNTILAEVIDQRVAHEKASGFEMFRAQEGRCWRLR
jgi:hypothetical protein